MTEQERPYFFTQQQRFILCLCGVATFWLLIFGAFVSWNTVLITDARIQIATQEKLAQQALAEAIARRFVAETR